MMLRFKIFLLLCLMVSLDAMCQYSTNHSLNRDEWVFGVGPSQALTDVGGSANIGTHGLKDWNWQAIRYAGMVAYRRRVSRNWSAKTAFTAAMLYGNDTYSKNIFRHNRNLNFRTPVFELSEQIEYYFYQYDQPGRHYHIKHAHGARNLTMDAYLFAGIGGFYYNPQGYWNGLWYNLRPLSTEGEGLPGGPHEYSQFAVSVPLGIGFKYLLNPQWSVGMEISDRFWTSTDYLDDDHGNYYNNATILHDKGPIAAHFADPSLGLVDGQTDAGQERGDPRYNDTYMFLFFTVNYRPSALAKHGGSGRHKKKLHF